MNHQHRVSGKASLRLGILLLLALAIYLLVTLTPLNPSDITPTRIKEFILTLGFWGPVAFVALYALRGVFLIIPAGIMSLTGGLVYGKWMGTLLIMIGAVLGACLSFLIARHLGRKFIEHFGWLHKGRIKSFDEKSEDYGFKIVLFVRLIPLFQYDAVNFGAGLSRIRLKDFALASMIGMIPGAFVNALLGSSLENILSVQFFVGLGLFVLLIFVPVIYKVLKNRRHVSPS